MAALALMTAACSNDDNEITQQTQKGGGITITAQLAPKTNGADTRAVSPATDKIVSEWAVGEKIAILYEVNNVKKETDATIIAVSDGTDGKAKGTATIEFSVANGTADNTACTLVYPAKLSDNTTTVYKDDLSGLKDYATLFPSGTQDGTLNTNMDIREGAGTIQTSTPSLTVTTQPAAQYAIFKFTIQDINGNSKNATAFKLNKVGDTSETEIFTFSLATNDGTSEFYYVLPVLSAGKYWFYATIGGKPYIAKATLGTATVAGKYYPTTVIMATVGDALIKPSASSNEFKFATAGTSGAVATIAYVVDASDATGDNHGLALALADENSSLELSWQDAIDVCGNKTPKLDGATWKLLSEPEWMSIIGGATGSDLSALANLLTLEYTSELILYWSSSNDPNYPTTNALAISFYNGNPYSDSKAKDAMYPYRRICRAGLAF